MSTALIVGSGPGGSAVADVLTAAGWDVVLMEKGRNHLLDPEDLTRPGNDYSNDEIKCMNRYFFGPDPLVEPRTFRISEADGDRLYVGEVNSIPTTVGGGGVHADGKVPRFREEDFRLLSTFGPQPDADVADWPLDYAELEPYYAEAERSIGVAGLAGTNPFAAWRSGPFPMPPGAPMYGAVRSTAAAERLGYHPYPAPSAANSVPYDGRPACNNCGFCAYFGCPVHAKGDPLALLLRAMATDRAELRADCTVTRVRMTGGRATGVDYLDRDGKPGTAEADWVVLAGGAVETPRLLLLSGLDHPLLGRYLTVHFQTIVVGVMQERLHAERGRAVTHVHDDPIVGDERSRAAARAAGLPWMRGGMVEHGGPMLPAMEAKFYPSGPQHRELMRSSPMRDRLWAFTMQGEDLAYPTNRVDLDPTVRDAYGLPVARVTYRGGRHELVASEHHGERLTAVLREMGAGFVTGTTSPGMAAKRDVTPAAPESRHVMGTTRMGVDPRTSVVDPYGRVHGVENLVVADSSVFVTSAGYGPTLTLVALALRAAHHIAGTMPAPDAGGTMPAPDAGGTMPAPDAAGTMPVDSTAGTQVPVRSAYPG